MPRTCPGGTVPDPEFCPLRTAHNYVDGTFYFNGHFPSGPAFEEEVGPRGPEVPVLKDVGIKYIWAASVGESKVQDSRISKPARVPTESSRVQSPVCTTSPRERDGGVRHQGGPGFFLRGFHVLRHEHFALS